MSTVIIKEVTENEDKYIEVDGEIVAGRNYLNTNGYYFECISSSIFNTALFQNIKSGEYVVAKYPRLYDVHKSDGTIDKNQISWSGGTYFISLEKAEQFYYGS